jgi:hypothetical protein
MIAKIGQDVAKFVAKLEAVLGPMGSTSRKANLDPAGRGELEVGLRMIGAKIDLDASNFDIRTEPPNLIGCGV